MKKLVTLFALSNMLLLSSCGINNQEELLNGFIVVKNSQGGTLSFDKNKNYKIGDIFTFDAVPENGYYLDSVKYNSDSIIQIVDEDTYSFTLTEEENIFEPIFKKETSDINCSFNILNSNGGEVSTLAKSFKYGSTINFTCFPSEGYEVSSINFNQKEIKINSSGLYSIKLNKNINILDVKFAKNDPNGCEIVNEMKVVRKVVDSSLNLMEDPYKNVNKDTFYANYQTATSYEDAYFRSKHYLMSGDISNFSHLPDTSNTITHNGFYLKNALAIYEVDQDGNYISYEVNNLNGESYKIYYGGAYSSLEDVSAYLFAFGDIPANYIPSKKASSSLIETTWGKYLRLNQSTFKGDVNSHPNEPLLTNILTTLNYYESDYGSNGGFSCGSSKTSIYNDGDKISRGTCRFVYSYSYKNGEEKFDLKDRHVFYTYNHYNDFQEYLNYKGGFTARFGNESAGNKYNEINPNKKPTPPHEYELFLNK